MKIGIIGSGNVGGTLGTRWARAGHEVIFSSSRPESKEVRELAAAAGPAARAASTAEAAGAGVLLIATPWPATREALLSLGDLGGKVVIDATNPLLDLDMLALGTTTSAAEQVAAWAPGARVVKAFNTVGYQVMANPVFGDSRALLFYCGDDPAAKEAVHRLAEEIGFDPLDAGPLRMARSLEPSALLWIHLAVKGGFGLEFAFRMLRR